jgi:hypothetical protein
MRRMAVLLPPPPLNFLIIIMTPQRIKSPLLYLSFLESVEALFRDFGQYHAPVQ